MLFWFLDHDQCKSSLYPWNSQCHHEDLVALAQPGQHAQPAVLDELRRDAVRALCHADVDPFESSQQFPCRKMALKDVNQPQKLPSVLQSPCSPLC